MRAAAVIPAGGSGLRMGGDVRKQYLRMGGEPLLLHTLRPFPYHQPRVDGPTEGNVMDFSTGATGIEGLIREIASIIPGTRAEALADLRPLEQRSRINWERIKVELGGRTIVDLTHADKPALSNFLVVGGSRAGETGGRDRATPRRWGGRPCGCGRGTDRRPHHPCGS